MSISSERSIVITGIGPISPVGIGVEAFWESLSQGRSGIGPIELMDYCASPHNVGGEVKEFSEKFARDYVPKKQRKNLRIMCREIQMGVTSAMLTTSHAGLDLESVDHERFGVEYGANLMFSPPDVLKDPCWECVEDGDAERTFHYEHWGSQGANADTMSGMGKMEPLWLLKYLPNMPACHIGIFIDARGPNNSLTQDEASGNLALAEAFRILQRGAADLMLVGVTGTRLHPVKTMHARLWDELAEYDDPPETWCRPFDKNRAGQVVAEGACALLLEHESAAKARGATIYGRVLGVGSSCVTSRQSEDFQRLALANAMRAALRDADLKPEDIGHINAHGLASVETDAQEAAAIHDVFGTYAGEVPVTALKSSLGNAGSGCGLLELAGSLLGLQNNLVPVTLNYAVPDEQCPLNVIHEQPLSVTNKTFLNINVNRMGQASAAVVQAE